MRVFSLIYGKGKLSIWGLMVLFGILVGFSIVQSTRLGIGMMMITITLLLTIGSGKPVRLLSVLLFLGFFSWAFVFQRQSIISLGHGLTLDGIRNGLFVFFALLLFLNLRNNEMRLMLQEIWPYVLFCFIASLSIFWTVSIEYTIRDLSVLWYPILLYISARIIIQSRKEIEYVEKWVRWGFFLALFLTILGKLFLLFQGKSIYVMERGNVMRFSDFDPVYQVGPGLLSLFGTAFFLQWIYGKKNRKYFFGFLLSGLLIWITVTRAYIFAFLASLTFVLLVSAKTKFRKAAVLLLGIMIILLILSVDNPIKRRMFWNSGSITALTIVENPLMLLRENTVNLSGRINIWQFLIGKLHRQVSPVVGGGLGTGRASLEGGKIFHATTVPHGNYAKYFAELGYVGLSMFVFLLIYGVIICLKGYKKSENVLAKVNYLTFGGGIIYIIISSIAYDTYISIGYLEYLFFFLVVAKVYEKARNQ